MMEFPNAKIILFAKAPVNGMVKTRLIPDIGEVAATKVHEQLVIHCLQVLTEAMLSPVELWCAPDTKHTFFAECEKKFPISLHKQQGAGLGERMHHALTLQPNASPTLLIGSDVPAISVDYLRKAMQVLSSGESWVFGPAEDGGYVLVGCNESDERMFSDILWGTNLVLKQTLDNAEEVGCKPFLLDALWDVDNYADLQRWRAIGF